jgi:hypothetical protein
VGFFKVRGVNINHPELEDLMFFEPGISEFRTEVYNTAAGLRPQGRASVHGEMLDAPAGRIDGVIAQQPSAREQ